MTAVPTPTDQLNDILRTFTESFEMPLRAYIGQWFETLRFGHEDAQEVALYALRSHGIEVNGDGYGDDFMWKARVGALNIVISPEVKPQAFDPNGEPVPRRHLAASLRNLLVVERDTAKELLGETDVASDNRSYVAGRIGSYDFAIRAIDDRWPDLPGTFDSITRLSDG